MKVIVPANNKGGVGKTSTAAQLAEYISSFPQEENGLKKRILLIDYDPQANASQQFLDMETDPSAPEGFIPPLHPDYSFDDQSWEGRSSIADIFYKELKTQGVVPYPTYLPNLDICPAHSNRLEQARQVRKSEVVKLVHSRLRDFLNDEDVRNNYDVVIIDTAPSKCPLTSSALKAATHMIIPCVMEHKAINGVFGMLQFWMQENNQRSEEDKLNLVGIFANMYDPRTALHTQLYRMLKENETIGKYILDEKLSRRIAFAEVGTNTAYPRSIFNYPDRDKGKQEAISLYRALTERIFNDG